MPEWEKDPDVITVNIPSLTNTSFTMDGNTKSPTVNNLNSTYVNQSGTTSAIDANTYTITWSLKDKTKYRWSDGTTSDKSATWKINWVNGTSHYSNDIYNRGWGTPLSNDTGQGSNALQTWNEAANGYIVIQNTHEINEDYPRSHSGLITGIAANKTLTVEGTIAHYNYCIPGERDGANLNGKMYILCGDPWGAYNDEKQSQSIRLNKSLIGSNFSFTVQTPNIAPNISRLWLWIDSVDGSYNLWGQVILHITRIYYSN